MLSPSLGQLERGALAVGGEVSDLAVVGHGRRRRSEAARGGCARGDRRVSRKRVEGRSGATHG